MAEHLAAARPAQDKCQEAVMQKIDLRKQLKHLHAPSAKQVQLVDVPELQFAMIDGAIEPGSEPGLSPAFAEALQAP